MYTPIACQTFLFAYLYKNAIFIFQISYFRLKISFHLFHVKWKTRIWGLPKDPNQLVLFSLLKEELHHSSAKTAPRLSDLESWPPGPWPVALSPCLLLHRIATVTVIHKSCECLMIYLCYILPWPVIGPEHQFLQAFMASYWSWIPDHLTVCFLPDDLASKCKWPKTSSGEVSLFEKFFQKH